MGLVGRLVGRLHQLAAGLGQAGRDVAVLAGRGHLPVQAVDVDLVEVGLLHLARGAGVPLDLDVVDGLLGAPVLVGDHRHRVIQLDHLQDARPALDGAVVDALQLAARHRALVDRGVDHPRQAGVDAELGRAVELGPGVQPRRGLADEGVFLGRLDLGLLVQLDLDGPGADRAVGELAAGGHVLDDAVLHLAFGGVALPLAGGGLDQAGPGAGAGLLHHAHRGAHALAADGLLRAIDAAPAVGGLFVQVAVGRAVLAFHLGPVAVQLLGDQHGQRRGRALPQLVVRQTHGDGVVRIDHHEGRELVRRDHLGALQQAHGPLAPDLGEGRVGQGHAHGEAAGGAEHGGDGVAAREAPAQGLGQSLVENGRVHDLTPSGRRPSARPPDGRPS